MKKALVAAGILIGSGITAVYLACRKRRCVSNRTQAINRLRNRAKHPRPI